MKAGMIVGIIGGVLGLITGFFAYGTAAVGNYAAATVGSADRFYIWQIAGIAAPVACIVGAAMAQSRPTPAMILMAGSAIVMALAFGIGTFTIFPIVLAAAGAALVFFDKERTTKGTTTA